MSQENVEVVRQWNAAFNRSDYDSFACFLHPEVEFIDHMPLPDVEQSARGAEELRAVLEQWREGFSGFQADVEEYVDTGDYVICATRWKFVSRDEAINLEWRGAEAHELIDGRIV